MAGALLVPHEDEPQLLVVVEGVEDGDDGPAGDAENGIDTFGLQGFKENVRAATLRHGTAPSSVDDGR